MTSPAPAAGATQAAPHPMARVARGGMASLVGAGVTALCTFALTVVITNAMPRGDAGVFFSVTSVFLIATAVGQLGTQTGLVYFVARSRTLGQWRNIDRYLRVALRPVVVVGAAMTVALLVFAHPLATVITPRHVDLATSYLRLLALFIPVVAVESVHLAGTRGLGSMRANTTIEQIGRPIAQLALVGVAVLGTSSALVGVAWSIAYLPAAVLAVLAYGKARRRVGHLTAEPLPGEAMQDADRLSGFWRFTLPRALTNIIQMIIQRFDIVLVGAISGAVAAAIYAAATRFIVIGQLGTNALTLAVQAPLAARLADNDRDGANHLYQTSTAWLILVTWPIYLTLILFARPLLAVFGHGYSTGLTVIIVIASSMLVSTGLGMVDTVLAMAGHTSWNLGNAILALAVNLGIDLWLIPSHGILGAAIGWAAAIIARNVSAVAQVAVSQRFHPLSVSTVVAIALSVVTFVGVGGAARLVLGASVAGLFVGVAAAGACYLAGLWLLRTQLELTALPRLGRSRRPNN